MPPSGATRKHGNADLWPVLPVGAGTAPRSGASGVYHAAVRMMLNAEVPAERRATPELGVLPAARLRRAVPTGASPCVGRLAERAKNYGSELRSLPA